jgi:3',5'-cyclic AMP phosphodiesterase CpdA
MRLLFLVFSLLVIACVSRSSQDLRFQESKTLSMRSFSVSPSSPSQFSFAVVGDTHVGNQDTTRMERILTAAAAEGDQFVIFLGDIVDKGIREDIVAVQDAVARSAFSGKALYVIGNHDVFEGGWNHYKELLGSSHFSVDVGNSRFIGIDTADGSLGKDQFDWLESELSKPPMENTFILSHYLPYVPHQRTYLRLSDEIEAARVMKLASRYQVRGWLGAHYHSFGTENIEGVTYVVAGGGGGRRMEPVKSFFFVQVIVNGSDVRFELRPVD